MFETVDSVSEKKIFQHFYTRSNLLPSLCASDLSLSSKRTHDCHGRNLKKKKKKRDRVGSNCRQFFIAPSYTSTERRQNRSVLKNSSSSRRSSAAEHVAYFCSPRQTLEAQRKGVAVGCLSPKEKDPNASLKTSSLSSAYPRLAPGRVARQPATRIRPFVLTHLPLPGSWA